MMFYGRKMLRKVSARCSRVERCLVHLCDAMKGNSEQDRKYVWYTCMFSCHFVKEDIFCDILFTTQDDDTLSNGVNTFL